MAWLSKIRQPQSCPADEQSLPQRMAALSQLLPASVKLMEKERIGSLTIKKHDTPKTPYQRIMESKHVNNDVKLSLTKQLELLNPFELNNILQMKLKNITRLR